MSNGGGRRRERSHPLATSQGFWVQQLSRRQGEGLGANHCGRRSRPTPFLTDENHDSREQGFGPGRVPVTVFSKLPERFAGTGVTPPPRSPSGRGATKHGMPTAALVYHPSHTAVPVQSSSSLSGTGIKRPMVSIWSIQKPAPATRHRQYHNGLVTLQRHLGFSPHF